MKLRFGDAVLECEAIAFDKDGTLVESLPFWWGLYESRAPIIEQGYGQSTLQIWADLVGVSPKDHQLHESGPLAVAPFNEEQTILAAAIYRTTKQPWTQCLHEAGSVISEADQAIPPENFACPMPGVPEVLYELSALDLPLAIVTTDSCDRAKRTAHHLQFSDSIQCIVCPDDVQNGKPAPDMLIRASEILDIPPARIVVVGDSLEDMEMAKAAGAQAVLIGAERKRDPSAMNLATACIETIREISAPGDR